MNPTMTAMTLVKSLLTTMTRMTTLVTPIPTSLPSATGAAKRRYVVWLNRRWSRKRRKRKRSRFARGRFAPYRRGSRLRFVTWRV